MAKPDPEALAKALRDNLRKRKAQERDTMSQPPAERDTPRQESALPE